MQLLLISVLYCMFIVYSYIPNISKQYSCRMKCVYFLMLVLVGGQSPECVGVMCSIIHSYKKNYVTIRIKGIVSRE
jgi:hypothetical protein